MNKFKDKEEIKSTIDELFINVENFRETENFQGMLNFISSFRYLSPYNAFLVYQQKPGTKYVMNATQWYKKYGRKIKPNARPLIILMPFGPVDYVYDISDTYSEKSQDSLFGENDDILENLIAPYKTLGYEPIKELGILEYSMRIQGISLNTDFKVGNGYAGKIEVVRDYVPQLEFRYKNTTIRYPANYILSVRDGVTAGEMFATIVHELGHLFCHHLFARPIGSWNVRNIDHVSTEFEAETVSCIVCKRMDIYTPSENYLYEYYCEHKKIPDVSIETIFTASNFILRMIDGISIKEGNLYKKDENFKKLINSL